MTAFLRILASLFVSAVCLYFASRNVQWSELKMILGSAKLWPVALGMLVSLVSFYLRAERWGVLLGPFQKLSRFVLFRWQVGGLFINNLVPLRLGELARAYWAGHKSRLSKSTVLATVVIERTLDVGSIALIGSLFLFFLGLSPGGGRLTLEKLLFLAATAAVFAIGARVFLRRFPPAAWLARLQGRVPARLYSFLEKFASGFKIVQNKREIVRLCFLSALIWCIDITIVQIVSRSLALNLTWAEAGATIVGLVLGVMVPAAPGAAGTYEAGGVAALTLLGHDKTLAFSYILLLHGAQYLFVLAMGIPILLAEGFHPRQMLQNMKEEKQDVP